MTLKLSRWSCAPEKPKGFDPFGDLDDDKPYGVAGTPPPGQSSDDNRRPCPMCGEMIVATAAKCRYCGEVFDETIKRSGKAKSGKGKKRAELKSIAQYQKGVLACIAGWILCIVAIFFAAIVLRPNLRPGASPAEIASASPIFGFLMLVGFVLNIASAVFGLLLGMKVSNVFVGILVAVCSFLCGCLGLIPLVIVNVMATNRLRNAGIDVGFFGADMSAFR